MKTVSICVYLRHLRIGGECALQTFDPRDAHAEARRELGLLINFGGITLGEGLHRIVNRLSPSVSPRLRVNQPG